MRLLSGKRQLVRLFDARDQSLLSQERFLPAFQVMRARRRDSDQVFRAGYQSCTVVSWSNDTLAKASAVPLHAIASETNVRTFQKDTLSAFILRPLFTLLVQYN